MLIKPDFLVCGGDTGRACIQKGEDVFLFGDQPAGNDRCGGGLTDFGDDLGHQCRQDFDQIRTGGFDLTVDVLICHGVNQKQPEDCKEPQFLGAFDKCGFGCDNTVGIRVFLKKVDCHFFGTQSIDEIQMDDRKLSGGFDGLHDVTDGDDVTV